uniref:Uncharacterized protein n=1 Tax=Candidatus Kentrum sp. DK TaxID=2126562 RepID=A0A450T0E7_9GAMM|nr:MAG: hypothetical protein BECKDK2373C_GA0170839_107619 [Candidatus Kentron sp. DK]
MHSSRRCGVPQRFGLECLPSDKRAGLNKNDAVDPTRLLKLCHCADIKVHFCNMPTMSSDSSR